MNVRKLISSVTILLVYLLAGLGFTSCEKEVEGVTEIIFTNVRSGKVSLSVGEEFTVKCLVLPEHLQETAQIDWETSDRKVARVRKGVIEAEGPGEATITASSGDTKATILVTVKAVQVEDLDFPSEAIEVYLGATVEVSFKNVTPADASLTTVEWEVKDYGNGDATVEADDDCIYITGTETGVAELYGYIDGEEIGHQEIVIKERIPVTSVSVTLSEQTVQYGGSLTVSTYVQPSNASLKDVVITCTPSNLATVSGNTITAGNQAGTVTVRATADGVSGTAEFEIVAPPLTLTIKGEGFGDGNSYNFLSPDTSVGNFPTSARLVLSANYEGVDLSKAVWTSSDANIVKVDTDGKVTGMGHGTAVVTAEVDGVKATYTVRSVKKSSFGIKLVNYYGKTPVSSSISTPKNIYIVDYFDPAFASDRNAFDFGLYHLYKVNLSTNGGLTAHFEGNSAVIRAESPCSGSVTFSLDNGKSVNLPVTMKVQSLTFIGVDTGKPYGTVQKGGSLSILHKDTDPKPGSGTFEAIRVYCNVGTSYEEGVSVLADAYSWKSNNSSTDPFGYGTIQWNNPKVGTHVITMTDFDPTFSITLTVDYEDF